MFSNERLLLLDDTRTMPTMSRTSSTSSLLLKKTLDPTEPKSESNNQFRIGSWFRAALSNSNVREVVFSTKVALLFPAIPMAVFANLYSCDGGWIFALSLMGLIPLAERLSFLTEQIAYSTGSTVGGLLNATCGKATELIVAVLALKHNKVQVLKYSLLGSVLSNLLLVLGTSFVCGGLANLSHGQTFERKQADVNTGLLMMALFCHSLPLIVSCGGGGGRSGVFGSEDDANRMLLLSRASSVVMLLAYAASIFFQLKTSSLRTSQQEEDSDEEEHKGEVGFWNAFVWIIVVTLLIALLSDYVVGTIEDASELWGVSMSFVSIVVLPIVGNAAEHSGSVIFALRNNLDISLGVALGSATQISLFVVPLCVLMSWIMGGQNQMGLQLSLLETGTLTFAVIITAFVLHDGTAHYMKGVILSLSYVLISICIFLYRIPSSLHQDKALSCY